MDWFQSGPPPPPPPPPPSSPTPFTLFRTPSVLPTYPAQAPSMSPRRRDFQHEDEDTESDEDTEMGEAPDPEVTLTTDLIAAVDTNDRGRIFINSICIDLLNLHYLIKDFIENVKRHDDEDLFYFLDQFEMLHYTASYFNYLIRQGMSLLSIIQFRDGIISNNLLIYDPQYDLYGYGGDWQPIDVGDQRSGGFYELKSLGRIEPTEFYKLLYFFELFYSRLNNDLIDYHAYREHHNPYSIRTSMQVLRYTTQTVNDNSFEVRQSEIKKAKKKAIEAKQAKIKAIKENKVIDADEQRAKRGEKTVKKTKDNRNTIFLKMRGIEGGTRYKRKVKRKTQRRSLHKNNKRTLKKNKRPARKTQRRRN